SSSTPRMRLESSTTAKADRAGITTTGTTMRFTGLGEHDRHRFESRRVGAQSCVAARRRFDCVLFCLAGALAGFASRDLAAELRPKPSDPVLPPRAFVLLGALEPLLGIDRQRLVGPVAVLLGRRWIDHSSDVAGPGEDEARFAAEKLRSGVGGLPRRDVILDR